MEVCQLITPERQEKVQSTQQWISYTSGGIPVLDRIFPYYSHVHTSTTLQTGDGPGTGLTDSGADVAKVTSETFDVWLMFRSQQGSPGDASTLSSCWVPLSHFTWSWSGEADLVSGQWTNNPASSSTPQPTSDSSTNIQPQWTNNINNINWP